MNRKMPIHYSYVYFLSKFSQYDASAKPVTFLWERGQLYYQQLQKKKLIIFFLYFYKKECLHINI